MPLFNLETPLPSTYILVKALDEDRSASVFYSLLGSRFQARCVTSLKTAAKETSEGLV